MTTTNMSPEEVLKYGKRIVLFSEGKGRNSRIYVIEDYRIFQESYLYFDDRKHITKRNPVEIMDIYNKIERVYSRKTKGVLIARRSGNYKSNQQRLLPLRKTGKGMCELITHKERSLEVFALMDCIENREEIQRQAQARIKQRSKAQNQQSNELLEAK